MTFRAQFIAHCHTGVFARLHIQEVMKPCKYNDITMRNKLCSKCHSIINTISLCVIPKIDDYLNPEFWINPDNCVENFCHTNDENPVVCPICRK
ncbi:unnamed protein product [Trichobilharzia regenti]|nr:unnamed protein product [Trichobilharzia regenti]